MAPLDLGQATPAMARTVLEVEKRSVLDQCKGLMRAGKPAHEVARVLRARYRLVAELAAAVEVIDDEHASRCRMPFAPVATLVSDLTPRPLPDVTHAAWSGIEHVVPSSHVSYRPGGPMPASEHYPTRRRTR